MLAITTVNDFTVRAPQIPAGAEPLSWKRASCGIWLRVWEIPSIKWSGDGKKSYSPRGGHDEKYDMKYQRREETKSFMSHRTAARPGSSPLTFPFVFLITWTDLHHFKVSSHQNKEASALKSLPMVGRKARMGSVCLSVFISGHKCIGPVKVSLSLDVIQLNA